MNFNYNSSLFTNSNNRSSSNSLYSVLGEYKSIRGGGYKKMLKEYYKKVGKENNSSNSTTTTNDTKANLTSTKSNADALQKSANALSTKGKDTLFVEKQLTKTDEKTGEKTTTTGYDMDAITKAVKNFAKDYNSTLDVASNSKDTSVLRNTLYMTKYTKALSNSLDKIGISVGSDNKLTVDEEKLKKADMNDVKSLLNGKNSFADAVATRATTIGNSAKQGMTTSGSLYKSNGSFSSDGLSNYDWFI